MSTPTSKPLVEVPAPALVPHAFGLFSAIKPEDVPDGQWEFGGILFRSKGCGGPVREWPRPCGPVDPGALTSKRGGGGPGEWIEGEVFPVVGRVECGPGGGFLADAQKIARERLAAGEQCAVEEHVWNMMQKAAPDPVGDPDLAKNLLQGLAALDAWLVRARGGVGVIHVPAELITLLSGAASPLVWGGTRVTTRLGSSVVFGVCYTAERRPDGKPGKDGEATIFASGPGVIQRGPVASYMGHDKTTNEVDGIAERVYAAALDCPLGWMTVKTSCAC